MRASGLFRLPRLSRTVCVATAIMSRSPCALQTPARPLHTSSVCYEAASSSSASSTSARHGRGDGTTADAPYSPGGRARMSTLGDYLHALPPGFRELLLYSPVIALLVFVLYQQKTYFRDPDEPWYAVLVVWRSRRVGGWLLENIDAPLPNARARSAVKTEKSENDGETVTDSRGAEFERPTLVHVGLRECAEIEQTRENSGTSVSPSPPIAPFSTVWTDGTATPTTTIWGRDVSALRVVRGTSGHARRTHDMTSMPLVSGYETVNARGDAPARTGQPWYWRMAHWRA